MTAIIIENEWTIDKSVKAFLKDNPDLFTHVIEEKYCLERDIKEILPGILESDAIIAASTWMYKDQLEDYLDKLLEISDRKTYKVYVRFLTRNLNQWKFSKHSWMRYPHLVEKIQKLLDKGFELYEFHEDYGTGFFKDELAEYPSIGREKYTYDRILLDEKTGLYYYDESHLKSDKEEYDIF